MDTLITVSALAGVIASGVQWAAIRFGFVRTHKRIVALVLSIGAGAVIAVAGGQTGAVDIFSAMTAALAASQAVFALVLTKIGAAPPTPGPTPPG